MNHMILDGSFTLTVLEDGDFPGEMNAIERDTALFTVRGKDHDLRIEDLKELINSCTQAMSILQLRRIERELPAILEDIKAKAQEYLEPCDELQVKIEPSDDSVLILVPINHHYKEGVARLDRFDEWWVEYTCALPFSVVVDLDWREGCPNCEGLKTVDDADGEWIPCPNCSDV